MRNVSEQQADQTSGESGSVGAGTDVSAAAPSESSASAKDNSAIEAHIESPDLVPAQVESPKVDAPKADTDAVTIGGRTLPKLMLMSPENQTWDYKFDSSWDRPHAASEPDPEAATSVSGKRRISAMAAVVALAIVAGAMGGALATVGVQHFASGDAASSSNLVLEASLARIDADVQALKAGVDHTAKTGMSQFNKTSDRLDKLEKAQAEPAAKLAKLSDAVDKLRIAPVTVAAAPAAASKDITGSVSPQAASPAPVAAPPKVEIARLPTVDGWVLRDVANGGALIEGRQGIFEVYAGDPVPGLGRVDAIRRQDGHWVVVTSKGLIVAR